MLVSRLPRFMFNAVPDTADANPQRAAGRPRATLATGLKLLLNGPTSQPAAGTSPPKTLQSGTDVLTRLKLSSSNAK